MSSSFQFTLRSLGFCVKLPLALAHTLLILLHSAFIFYLLFIVRFQMGTHPYTVVANYGIRRVKPVENRDEIQAQLVRTFSIFNTEIFSFPFSILPSGYE